MDETRRSGATSAARVSGLTGVLGGLACSAAMTAAALGIAGAGASAGAGMAGMAGMGSSASRTASNPVLAWLLRDGPALLVVSAVLVVLAVGLRRPWTVLPAVAAAALLYWGMNVQPRLAVMYAASIVGLLVWIGLLVTARHTRGPGGWRRPARPASVDPAASG